MLNIQHYASVVEILWNSEQGDKDIVDIINKNDKIITLTYISYITKIIL